MHLFHPQFVYLVPSCRRLARFARCGGDPAGVTGLPGLPQGPPRARQSHTKAPNWPSGRPNGAFGGFRKVLVQV